MQYKIANIKYYSHFRKIKAYKPEYWYLPEDNVGYIQIPKIATRSIRFALIQHFTGENILSSEKEKIKAYSEVHSQHIEHRKIRNITPGAFIFTFVRNPYDRIISCYRNKVSNPNLTETIFACYGIKTTDSFETFVHKISDIGDLESDRHFRSQSWFLYDDTHLLADFVGRLENLEYDWQKLMHRFKFGQLPHNNKSGGVGEFEISPKTKSLMQLRYSSDFENFYANAY